MLLSPIGVSLESHWCVTGQYYAHRNIDNIPVDRSPRWVYEIDRSFVGSLHWLLLLLTWCQWHLYPRSTLFLPLQQLHLKLTKGMDVLDLLVDIEKMEYHSMMFHSQKDYSIMMFHCNLCCTCQSACEAEWKYGWLRGKQMMSACVEIMMFGCLELQKTTKKRKNSKNSSAGHKNLVPNNNIGYFNINMACSDSCLT